MRRGLLVGLVLLGGGLLTACTPPTYDLAGVYKDDSGQIMVEAGRCSNEGQISGFYLAGPPVEGEPSSTRTTGHVRGDTHPGPFPLLAPVPGPDGKPGAAPPLDAGSYYLRFHVLKDEHRVLYSSATSFESGDIQALRPGQVWANDKAMSRDHFRTYLRDAC
ncbi:hypothetical protein ABT024_18860 [Streptomyces sp. NPDC002812]|uniref:hypothetical protein n=1 Tax=Streptomyces sp. NPDC002812 TaxID=3154434 RepID=UPI00333488D5